jgi:hypothetical protein
MFEIDQRTEGHGRPYRGPSEIAGRQKGLALAPTERLDFRGTGMDISDPVLFRDAAAASSREASRMVLPISVSGVGAAAFASNHRLTTDMP